MKKIVSIAIVAIMILALFMPASAAPPVTVSNFAQFKTALEDATTTHIVFAGDIQIENHGVVINPAKPELVIDGGGYTMTSHYRGSSTPDTLRLTSLKTLKSITLQNMVIVNLNKQGVVHVPDSSSYSDVTVTYNNISMVGAQIIEAKKSIAVFRNCNINLTPFIGNHPSEVAAAAHVRLEGYINIIKDAPGCKMELFHIHAKGGGLSVASGAVVNVEDNVGIGRPKDWGFVKVPYGSCYIRFEDDSKFSYVGNNIFQKGEEISEVYIGRRAEISIRTYGNFFSENGMFSVCGRMTIETGAKVNLLGLGNDKDKPVIWLDKGSELLINNPREVLIYNSYPKSSKDGLAIRADGAKITTFTANNIELLEFWSMNVRAYDSLFGPTREWSNPNGSLFSVSVSQKEKKTTSVFYNGYFGYSPLNAATATLNNVNVIRINGGFAQNEATIIREFYDIDNPYGAPLKVVAPLSVSRGAYNYPHDAIPGYEPAGLRLDSDPSAGTISVGETKKIVYLYRKLTKDIRVDVVWDDFNNMHSTRPASVGVQLFQNGGLSAYATAPVLSTVNTHTFTAPRYDASLIPFVYTVDYVAPVSGYTAAITGNADSGFVITFTLIRQFDLDVTVVWDDYSDLLGRRPATITVGIFRNGSPFQMQNVATVSAPVNRQTVTFIDMPRYDAMGNIYTYTAVQQAIPGGFYYAPQISGFTITNRIFD